MPNQNSADTFARVVVGFVIVLGLAGIVRLIPEIFSDASLSQGERLSFVGAIILVLIGIGLVLVQKWKMWKKETFRREKW